MIYGYIENMIYGYIETHSERMILLRVLWVGGGRVRGEGSRERSRKSF